METATKETLDYIDRVLARQDAAAHELWTVLTALRGPDAVASADKLKHATTAHIRSAALPLTALAQLDTQRRRGMYGLPAVFATGGYFQPRNEDCVGDRFADSHFIGHAERAAEVLGIWLAQG
jgi:hypothetical protein